LTGPLEIDFSMKIMTQHEDEVTEGEKIVADAKERIVRFEESLIERYRHGQGSQGSPVKPGTVLDRETAIKNLREKAKRLEDMWQKTLQVRLEDYGPQKNLMWEDIINWLWNAVQDSLTISRETGEPFWPELSAPEARGTRRADSDTPPPSGRGDMIQRRWSTCILYKGDVLLAKT
jgi:hypothetical protein